MSQQDTEQHTAHDAANEPSGAAEPSEQAGTSEQPGRSEQAGPYRSFAPSPAPQVGPPYALVAPPTVGSNESTDRGLAIAALVCGAVGIGPVAVVLGHLALRRGASPGETRGLAIAGLVLGYVTTVGWLVGMLIAFVSLLIPIVLVAIMAIASGTG